MKYSIASLERCTYTDREASLLYTEIIREAIMHDKVARHIDMVLNDDLLLLDDGMLIARALLSIRNKAALRREELLKTLVYLEKSYKLNPGCRSAHRFCGRNTWGYYHSLLNDLKWYREGRIVPEELYLRFHVRK